MSPMGRRPRFFFFRRGDDGHKSRFDSLFLSSHLPLFSIYDFCAPDYIELPEGHTGADEIYYYWPKKTSIRV